MHHEETCRRCMLSKSGIGGVGVLPANVLTLRCACSKSAFLIMDGVLVPRELPGRLTSLALLGLKLAAGLEGRLPSSYRDHAEFFLPRAKSASTGSMVPPHWEAVRIVPGEAVGGGVGESVRNKGWICD